MKIYEVLTEFDNISETDSNAAIVKSMVDPAARQRFAKLRSDTTAKLTDPNYDHNPDALKQHNAAPNQKREEYIEHMKNIEMFDNPHQMIKIALNNAGLTPEEVLQNLPKGYQIPQQKSGVLDKVSNAIGEMDDVKSADAVNNAIQQAIAQKKMTYIDPTTGKEASVLNPSKINEPGSELRFKHAHNYPLTPQEKAEMRPWLNRDGSFMKMPVTQMPPEKLIQWGLTDHPDVPPATLTAAKKKFPGNFQETVATGAGAEINNKAGMPSPTSKLFKGVQIEVRPNKAGGFDIISDNSPAAATVVQSFDNVEDANKYAKMLDDEDVKTLSSMSPSIKVSDDADLNSLRRNAGL